MKQLHLLITIILICSIGCSCKPSFEEQDTIEHSTTNSLCDSTNCKQQIDLSISKEILLGKYKPAKDSNYVLIPSYMCKNKVLYCHKEVYKAYVRMREAAKKDGIELTILSALRTYDDQLSIWNRKWHSSSYTRYKSDISRVHAIMRYSAMPGTSRHHWGTELDFISSKLNYWNSAEGKRTYQWLNKNAQQYGFYQPYTADPKRSGYAEERWHWSYKSIATQYLAAYQQKITAEDLCGFYGSYLVDSLHIIQTHVMGVAM